MIIYGKYIIEPQYDEMILIPDKNEDLFICYYDVDYQNETYNTKVLNSEGNEILKEYSKVEPIENYDNSKTWYEQGILKYEADGKYGLINFKGKKILEEEYEKIYPLSGIEKSIVVEQNGNKGLVNSSLEELVIDLKYSNIEALTKNYSDGYIVSNSEGKKGIVTSSGKVIFDCKYDKIENLTGNDMYIVSKENKNILINKKEEEILNIEDKIIKSINNNNLVYEQSGKYGVIDTKNENIFNPEFEYIKFIFDKFYIAKKDGKYGIINTEGETKLDFYYNNITYIENANIIEAEKVNNKTDLLNNKFELKLVDVIVSEINIDKGFLRVRDGENYKYYNFKFDEKTNNEVMPTNTLFLIKENGKYGYVNINGEKIVDAIYDDAKEQNEYGYCAVKKDGVWGCLKSDGTVIVKPSINLDNNLYIDFISEWYFYNNMNLNVYTK